MPFFPENIHVLVIDDKIGSPKPEFRKHTQYFDHRLKSQLLEKLKKNDRWRGDIYIHYLNSPGKLETILAGSDYDKIVPVDIILLDINFERLGDADSDDAFNNLTSSFLYEGPEYAGIPIYRFLTSYSRHGIASIPILIISGDNIVEIPPTTNMDKKKIYTEFINELDLNNLKEIFIHKNDQIDWIGHTAKIIHQNFEMYYTNTNDKQAKKKTAHLIHRLQNEYHFFRKLDIERDKNELRQCVKPYKYPKYRFYLCNEKITIKHNYEGEDPSPFEGELSLPTDKPPKKIDFQFFVPLDLGLDWLSDLYSLYSYKHNPKQYKTQKDLTDRAELTKVRYYGNKYQTKVYPIINLNCKLCLQCIHKNLCKFKAIKYDPNIGIIISQALCRNCGHCVEKSQAGEICEYSAIEYGNFIKQDIIKFMGEEFLNRIFLAATPVTAFSGFDTKDGFDGIDFYINKLFHLYVNGLPGGIILKTVYLEKLEDNEDENLPYIENIREFNVKRCYSEPHEFGHLNDLYNTGKTANENINVTDLCELLKRIQQNNQIFDVFKKFLYKHKGHFKCEKDIQNQLPEMIKDFLYKNRFLKSLVLSFGSHSYSKDIWKTFFEKVFGNKKNEAFKFIEINARHSMRSISRDCSLKEGNAVLNPYIFGVDEYFISPDLSNYTGFWSRFEDWIEIIQSLGKEHKKRIMIKLPYRSDLNMLVYIIRKVIKRSVLKEKTRDQFGIRAISAINTIKSPFPTRFLKLHQQEGLISDFNKLPQISGKGLSQLKNITLHTLSNICGPSSDGEEDGLDISASGGIMSMEDIYQSVALGAKTVQISSWYLLQGNKIQMQKNGEIKEGEESRFYFNTMRLGKIPRRCIQFMPERCVLCGRCTDTYYCDAIVNKFTKETVTDTEDKGLIPKSPIIYFDFCSGCGLCESVCSSSALKLEYENALKKEPTDHLSGIKTAEKAQLNNCPVCENRDGHIFVYPLEPEESETVPKYRQFYYCSNCKVMYSYLRQNAAESIEKSLHIEALIDMEIKYDENRCYFSFESNEINNLISVTKKSSESLQIDLKIPHLFDIKFKAAENVDFEIFEKLENDEIHRLSQENTLRFSIHGNRKKIFHEPIRLHFKPKPV